MRHGSKKLYSGTTEYNFKFKKDMAVREEGIVVSNDQFRDLRTESSCSNSTKKCIDERLLQYVSTENYIMLTPDPQRAGKVVPLEEFIRH